jgi:hypothetical protein
MNKACAYCRNEIPAEAKKCIACGSYQNPWLNWLLYFSGVAGGLSILAAAIIFIASNLGELEKRYAWKDSIDMPNFEYRKAWENYVSFSIYNSGHGDVIILGARYYPAGQKHKFGMATHAMHRLIRPNELIIESSYDIAEQNKIDEERGEGQPGKTIDWQATTNLECQRAADLATDLSKQCFSFDSHSPNSPVLNGYIGRLKASEKSACMFDGEFVVTAFSTKTKKTFETIFPTRSIVVRYMNEKNCTNSG